MEYLRDEYLGYLTGERVQRPMFVELFGPLVGLDAEWRSQGATADEIAMIAFGFDYCRRFQVPVHTGLLGQRPDQVEVDTDEYQILRDSYGRRVKLVKKSATIPLPMEYPVRTMDDWLAIKPRYRFDESRFDDDWLDRTRAARDNGALIVAGIPGGFDEPRQLLGEEECCVAYYEQPEMMHDMLSTIGDTAYLVLERVVSQVPIDVLSVHEDLAGRSGPLVGPLQIDEFIGPYYRRLWDLVAAHGARVFQQDSDGNINAVIPAFMRAGINCVFPMEPAAGMDIVETRALYGRSLMMLGGVDKHVLRQGPEAIRRELEYKLQPQMQTGGIVFGLDHRIPNGTPLANYRYYVRTARELLGLDPNPPAGWQRMAF